MTKDWNEVDWSNDDDIIANVAPWATPELLRELRKEAANFDPTPANIGQKIKFTLTEALVQQLITVCLISVPQSEHS